MQAFGLYAGVGVLIFLGLAGFSLVVWAASKV